MKPQIQDAISLLGYKSSYTSDNGKIESWDIGSPKTGEKQPTQAEIDAELKKLEDQYDAKEYQLSRASEYPSIVDQLDEIFHNGIDSWKAIIKQTKDKYPKG